MADVLSRLRAPIAPETYRRVTVVALVLLVGIVVTGAAVRLTGSGLGCSDWPGCTKDKFVASMDLHPMVEFVNRMITGLVSVAVMLAVLGSLRRAPRRRDLTVLSLGLVAGVVGQIIIGKIVVETHLNPWWVQMHMVVSLLLVLDAMVLTHRAGLPDAAAVRPSVTPALLRWGWVTTLLATLVLLTGTLVTGSGPHSGQNRGDDPVRRLPIAVHDAARVHGITVMAFLAVTLWVLVQARRHHGPGPLRRATEFLLTVLVLQGALGYTQYFTGVPPLLVGLHVLGACLVWVAALHLVLQMRSPLEATPSEAPSWDGALDADARSRGDLVT